MTTRSSIMRRRSLEPASHLFHVGQMVLMKSRFGNAGRSAELFRVTGMLPARDNSPQYRIRSDDERHDRVATQDSLEPLGATPGERGMTLI